MILLFSHFIIIAICLIMKILELSDDVIGLAFVICSSIITSIYVLQLKGVSRWVKLIILFGFFLRLFLVVIDVFFTRIPGAASDDDGFYESSVRVYNSGYELFGQNVYGGAYSKLLSIFYLFIGSSRFSAQYLNVFLYVVCAVIFLRALKNFGVSQRPISIAMVILCLLPNVIMTNSILRRETFMELCICASLLFFSKWHKTRRTNYCILTILFVALAALFHTAMIFGVVVFALYFTLYDKNKNRVSFSLNDFGKLIVVLICVITAGLGFLSMWDNKFSSLTDMDDVYASVNRTRGGSVYLENYKIDSVGQLLLFTPLKLFYFLFSPLPWQFRNVLDVVSFVFDSLIYIFLVIKIVRSSKSSESKALFCVFFFLAVIFALGTFTSGTAIRHRSSLLPFLIACYYVLELDTGTFIDSNKCKNEKKELTR